MIDQILIGKITSKSFTNLHFQVQTVFTVKLEMHYNTVGAYL